MHGGDPITKVGLSFLIASQHLSRSLDLSKSYPLLRSMAMPCSSPYSLHSFPTLSGLKTSITSTPINCSLRFSADCLMTASLIRSLEKTSCRLFPSMALATISSSSWRARTAPKSTSASAFADCVPIASSPSSLMIIFVPDSIS